VRLTTENTAIVLDSTVDLTDERRLPANWRIVAQHVVFGDKSFRDGVDLSPDAFYRRLDASPVHPKTSQPSAAEFAAAYDAVGEYEHVLVLVLSSRLSGTYDSARVAAADAGRRVSVFDTRTVSAGMLLLAEAVQRRLDEGTEARELRLAVERFRRIGRFVLTFQTLEFLVRGGRIGKAAGLAASLLEIKPVFELADGELEPVRRFRTRRRALRALKETFATAVGQQPGLHVAVAHANAPLEAEALAGAVRRAHPNASLDHVGLFGPAIGAHSGPGAVGLAWLPEAVSDTSRRA
jgi:DegV family protein with EDD domain